MSNKVKGWLLVDGIGIAINVLLTIFFCNICEAISYDMLRIVAKIAIVGFFTIINLIILIFFFTYWWSDVKWSQCKNWWKRKKSNLLK